MQLIFSELESYFVKKINDTPLVSVIVPAYNVKDYICACLASLIKQTLTNIEIIVVDDGSTDETADIIEKFALKDARIKFFKQENKGVGAARNFGLSVAKGEYIGLVDSDDWVDANYFDDLYSSAITNKTEISSANILKHKGGYDKFNLKYKSTKIAQNINDKIALCQDKKQRFFYIWNKIYKRKMLLDNDIKFPEGRIYEDVIFSMKAIYYSDKVVSVPTTAYHYIERVGSIINAKNPEKRNQRHAQRTIAYKELQAFANEHDIKLPERANYYDVEKIGFFLKIYKGSHKMKIMLFGLFPVFIKKIK